VFDRVETPMPTADSSAAKLSLSPGRMGRKLTVALGGWFAPFFVVCQRNVVTRSPRWGAPSVERPRSVIV
jgi:hypothetical protein